MPFSGQRFWQAPLLPLFPKPPGPPPPALAASYFSLKPRSTSSIIGSRSLITACKQTLGGLSATEINQLFEGRGGFTGEVASNWRTSQGAASGLRNPPTFGQLSWNTHDLSIADCAACHFYTPSHRLSSSSRSRPHAVIKQRR